MKIKYTFEKLKHEALKYKTRSEFQSSGAYGAAFRFGYFERSLFSMERKQTRMSSKMSNFLGAIYE